MDSAFSRVCNEHVKRFTCEIHSSRNFSFSDTTRNACTNEPIKTRSNFVSLPRTQYQCFVQVPFRVGSEDLNDITFCWASHKTYGWNENKVEISFSRKLHIMLTSTHARSRKRSLLSASFPPPRKGAMINVLWPSLFFGLRGFQWSQFFTGYPMNTMKCLHVR